MMRLELPTESLLTSRDLAAMFGVAVTTIRRWHRAGELPTPVCLSDGHILRWPQDEIEAWLQEQKETERANCSKN